MPAAVVKGIIVSISIITALGVAVLENPQIQVWLEEQRRRLVELLRSIGEELDPQSRRTAEAFAYEGRTPATDEGLRREVSGSNEAAAVATGRTLSSPSTIRRIPIQGSTKPEEAEERRRKGREYLAKRNQQMYEMQQRKKAEKSEGAATPPSPTSFDAMVDDEGKLRLEEAIKELPPMPESDPVPEPMQAEMREVDRSLSQPMLEGQAGPSSGAAGWSFGSLLANPFDDENALERSETPKPPVPPKVKFDIPDDPPISTIPGSFPRRRPSPPPENIEQLMDEDLSYDEQMAIALSLSEAEAAKSAEPTAQEIDNFNLQLRAAIEASLKDSKIRQASMEIPEASTPRAGPVIATPQPLVDLTPPSPTLRPQEQASRPRWETIFDQQYSPSHEPLSLASGAPRSEDEEEDELYRVTPELTHARLATLNSQHTWSDWSAPSSQPSMPYDPVREAASQTLSPPQAAPEASFYSAASSAQSPASSHTMDFEHTPDPILFPSETDSESDTFASLADPSSHTQSRARSETSEIEVLDVTYDSDVDMLSDQEADGIRTPDSDNWTEVGSRDGDSEEERVMASTS